MREVIPELPSVLEAESQVEKETGKATQKENIYVISFMLSVKMKMQKEITK